MAEPISKTHTQRYTQHFYIDVIYNCKFQPNTNTKYTPVNRLITANLSGFRNPNWRREVAEHRNATTSMTASRVSVSMTNANLSHVSRKGYLCQLPDYKTDLVHKITGKFVYTNDYDWSPHGSYSATVANEAAAKFYNKAQDRLSPVKGGTILGELRETLRSLRSPLKSLRTLISDHSDRTLRIKKSSPGRPNSTSVRGAIRESYLEMAFAWLPLSNDVQDVVDYLQSDRDRLRQEYQRISAFAEKRTVTSEGAGNPGPSPSGFYDQKMWRRTLETVQAMQKGELRLAVGDNLSSTTRELGIIPSQFLPTAWEILPWSFIADYFANIGSVINAFSVPSSSITWVMRTERVISRAFSGGYASPGWYGTVGFANVACHQVRRTGLPNGGVPSFEWDPYLNLRQVMNIGALLDGIRSRHSR